MKILACDLDGTLVISEQNLIIKENIEAVKKLRENGHKFIISTGRDLIGVKHILDAHTDLEFDYLVLCNGALILDSNFNTIFKGTIPHSTAIDVYNKFYNLNDAAMYLAYDGGSSMFFEGDETEHKDFLGMFDKINNQNELFSVEREYNILSVFSKSKSDESAEKIKELLLDTFGDTLSIFRNQVFIDIMAKDCSKGLGLKKVIELEKWNLDNLYSIGDSFNDLSMFDITKNSYTFNHASEDVKSFANFKVDFVHECISNILSE